MKVAKGTTGFIIRRQSSTAARPQPVSNKARYLKYSDNIRNIQARCPQNISNENEHNYKEKLTNLSTQWELLI